MVTLKEKEMKYTIEELTEIYWNTGMIPYCDKKYEWIERYEDATRKPFIERTELPLAKVFDYD